MACKKDQPTITPPSSVKFGGYDPSPAASLKEVQTAMDSLNKAPLEGGEVKVSFPPPLPKKIVVEEFDSEVGSIGVAIGVGKSLVVLDNSSIGPTLDQRSRGDSFISQGEKLTDSFRIASGRYWTTEPGGKNIVFLNPAKVGDVKISSPFKVMDFDFLKSGAVYLKDIKKSERGAAPQPLDELSQNIKGTQVSPTGSTMATQQWVLVKNDTFTEFGPPAPFNPEINQNESFYDLSFKMGIPFSDRELSKYNGQIKPISARVLPWYNFYVKKYEDVVSNVSVSEALLPNLYALSSVLSEESKNVDLINHVSLAGNLDKKELPNKSSIGVFIGYTFVEELKKTVGQYFDKYGRAQARIYRSKPKEVAAFLQPFQLTATLANQVRLLTDKEILAGLEKKFSNVLFTLENLSLLNKYEGKKHMFPMYCDIEFSTDKKTSVAEILRDTKLSANLQSRVVNNITTNKGFELNKFFEAREVMIATENKTVSRQISLDTTDRRVWDLSEWIIDFEKQDSKSGEGIATPQQLAAAELSNIEDIAIFLGADKQEQLVSNDPQMKFFRQIMKLVFVGKIRKLISDKFRTYEEMMTGKFAHSETVMYRVEKLSGNTTVQNFYFPNSNSIDVLHFVDTQVKYGVPYTYRIHAYQAVIGSKYNYSDMTISGDYASFLVTQYPVVKMVELPYFEYTTKVLDRAPVFPDIEMVPYKGISDKFLFLLRSNTGEYLLQPEIIEESDTAIFEEQRLVQDVVPGAPILFRSDDHSGVFEIYRLETKPKSYQDFRGALLTSVATDISKLTPQSATSAAFVDDIEPNKKYYYMFRVIDIHGHISNPTPVYEVEMVDERGTVYPNTGVLEFDAPKSFPSRSGKKYLMIAPAFTQTIINEEKSGITEQDSAENVRKVFLGVEKETAWGKTFKIRLTSRSTGKQVDINVDLTSTDIKIPSTSE